MSKLLKAGLSLGMVALAVAPLAAPVLAGSHPLVALLLRDFFSGLCHQNPARSFLVYGKPASVCVRCLGIYVGVALGAMLPAGRALAARWLPLALLLNLLDVVTATVHWHGNLTLLRFSLGWLLGVGAGAVLSGAASFEIAPYLADLRQHINPRLG